MIVHYCKKSACGLNIVVVKVDREYYLNNKNSQKILVHLQYLFEKPVYLYSDEVSEDGIGEHEWILKYIRMFEAHWHFDQLEFK
ncbi:hypothetical protein ACFQZE_06705 [Paenibacillus sp. GCM10027627]|uniref:hypothetical protein n=1 Tax=unclassified Paenibacillus TaxID=185978 RepID=UPI003633B09D